MTIIVCPYAPWQIFYREASYFTFIRSSKKYVELDLTSEVKYFQEHVHFSGNLLVWVPTCHCLGNMHVWQPSVKLPSNCETASLTVMHA